MADNISKICADYLRECYPELKSSHAHELIAAFFGYKSHAALLVDKRNFVDYLDQAAILVPDSSVVDDRRRRLKELCDQLPHSGRLVDDLVQFLQSDELFEGEVWDCFDIGEYVMEEYLPAHLDENLDLELEDVTASINAIFDEISYDECDVDETNSGVTVTVRGTYSGYSLDDNGADDAAEPVIDLEVTVYLRRCAGRISFEEPEVDVIGTLHAEAIDDDDDDDDDEKTEENKEQTVAAVF